VKFASRALFFILATIAWLGVSAIAVFVTLLPCGMGPDAPCNAYNPIAAWTAFAFALAGYLAFSFVTFRRWSR
jgi:hypothetical protein